MGRLSIQILEGVAPTVVADLVELQHVLEEADVKARNVSRPNIIDLTASNGDTLSMVVGGDETVLGFTSGNGSPPYYASRGESDVVEPVMTCYLHSVHHTEFPRHAVISREAGLMATIDFLELGGLPRCVRWQEV
jgi:hypothetical protein